MQAVNPYKSPQAESLSVTSNVTHQPKLFTIHGRIGRIRYLAYSLFAFVLFALIIGVVVAISIPLLTTSGVSGGVSTFLILAMYIPLIIFSIVLAKRRLNDLNHSGWWQLILYIPIIGILMALYLLFWPGTKQENNFGPVPTKNSNLLLIAGVIGPFIAIVIFAAIAVPAYQDYIARSKQALESIN